MKTVESLDRHFARSDSFPKVSPRGIEELKAKGLFMDFVALRARVTGIFGVRNFAGIPTVTEDPVATTSIKERYDDRFSLQFPEFADDTKEQRLERYKKYSTIADSVVDELSKNFLGNTARNQVDLINELRDIHHPIDLMAIVFNRDEYRVTRFEAYRKLMLMEYAQDIDHASRQSEGSLDEINYFLNKNILNKDQRRGTQERLFIVSTHNPDTFECTEYTEFDTRQEAQAYQNERPGTKLTVLPTRRLASGNRRIFISTREKPIVSQVVKLLRKRSHEPIGTVQDVFGILGVVESYRDVRRIVEQFIASAQSSESEIQITDIEDNILKGDYSAENGGSSKDFRACKLQAKFHGLNVEFVIHTVETYLDSLYRYGVSHDEFEAKRVFETGVIERLFPPEVYDLDQTESMYQQAIAQIRARIKNN